LHKLKELIIELSQNCNLDCIMCGFGKSNNASDKFMSFDNFKLTYEKLGKYSEKIRLNGRGESTIHPQFKDVLKYIGESNQITLFTNGNYRDKEINDLFTLYSVQLFFSMDSPDKDNLEKIRRGVSFEILDNNIEELRKLDPRPYIVFTLQEININDIISIAKYAISKNCNLIYNVVRRDSGIEVFQALVKEKYSVIVNSFNTVKTLYSLTGLECLIPDQISGINIYSNIQTTCGTRNICPNINGELCILYNGDVTPCNMFNPYIYGNLFIDSIENILNSDKRKWFVQNYKDYYYCKNCACLVR